MVLRSYSSSRWEALGEIPRGPYLVRSLGFTYGVTGTLNPDATCNYAFAGTYGTDDYFRRLDGSYFLWWDGANTKWVISIALGIHGTLSWERVDPAIVGTYQPAGTATGVATVQLGEHP